MSFAELRVPVLVPPLVPKTTLKPPEVCTFPAASFAVSVTVLVPPEKTLFGETVTSELERETGPGVTVMVVGAGVLVTAPVLIVAPSETFPARIPVKFAV